MHHLTAMLVLLILSTCSTGAASYRRETPTVEPLVTYSYKGGDFPQAWPIPPLDDVYLAHEDGIHYAIDTELGAAEWHATLPSGGQVLYLGNDFHPFTLLMFHQLWCLDIVRDILVKFHFDTSPNATYKHPELAEHCMNYLRQTVMCRADVHLEHVRASGGPQVVVSDITHSCKDWSAVYREAEDNYQTYLAKISGL
ncbi:hypothetical protein V8D89_014551 [Ganoderma adspersum]